MRFAFLHSPITLSSFILILSLPLCSFQLAVLSTLTYQPLCKGCPPSGHLIISTWHLTIFTNTKMNTHRQVYQLLLVTKILQEKQNSKSMQLIATILFPLLNHQGWYLYLVTIRWFGMRLDTLSTLFLATVAFISIPLASRKPPAHTLCIFPVIRHLFPFSFLLPLIP